MPRTHATSYRLTADLVSAHAGTSGIVCLDASAEGKHQPLHARRPDASTNRRAADVLAEMRGDGAYGPACVSVVEPAAPLDDVLLVTIEGPIEERAGWHDPCGGWVDGHDAIYERLAAAFEIGDVVLSGRTPGGAVSGGPEMMRRAQEMKARHGRRCIGHTETGVHSMGLWWFAAICDEIHVSPDARIGAAGARAAHASIAGALEKEGVAFTFSAWPNDGKIAGVPELPLSPEGKARMDRDVAIAGEMFAATLATCPTMRRAGLTRDGIAALGADSLTGQAAVDAGLADSVATLEDVMAMALAEAGTGATTMEDKDQPGGDAPETPEEAKACARCTLALDPMDAFCRKCGEPTVPPKDDEKPADSDARGSAAVRVAGPTVAKAAPISAEARYASASIPALRAAAATMHGILDTVARHVGAKTHAEIVGCVEATAKDARNAIRYRGERDTERKANLVRERIDILQSLSAADPAGHPRGKLLVDVVEGDKVVGVKPARLWGDGPEGRTIENLRGYARTVLGAAPTKERSPYDGPPMEANATAAAERNAGAKPNAAKAAPAVKAAVRAGVNEDEAAALYAREFGGAS